MKMCQPHWEELRAAVDARGLTPFIANNSEEALTRMTGQLEGASDKVTFDPLLNANWAIFSNALEAGGLYLLGAKEDGRPHCPLCEVETNLGEGTAAKWICYATDEQLERAREHGLVSVQ